MLSKEKIIEKIDKHLEKSGKRYYYEFYIGVSNDAATQLFNKHHVNKENSWWIYITAKNSDDANDIRDHYLGKGMRGSSSVGDDNSNMVYCYVVTPTTTE